MAFPWTGVKKQLGLREDIDSARAEGRHEAALSLLRKYEKALSPEPVDPLLESLLLAEQSMADGSNDKAKSHLEKVAHDNSPSGLEGKALLATLLLSIGQSADTHLDGVVQRLGDASQREHIGTAHRLYVLLHALQARARQQEDGNDPLQAIATYRLVQDVAKDFAQRKTLVTGDRAKELVNDADYRIPHLHLQAGDVKSAVGGLREAVRSPIAPGQNQRKRVLRLLSQTLLYSPKARKDYQPLSTEGSGGSATLLEEAVTAALHLERDHMARHPSSEVYDDLSLAYGRVGDYSATCDSLELGIANRKTDIHLWRQYALSLYAAGRYGKALAVIKECIELAPRPVLLLLAAKVCLNHLDKYEEAVHHATRCVEVLISFPNSHLVPKAYQVLGAALSGLAVTQRGQESAESHERAREAFGKAEERGSREPLLVFHMALESAAVRDIDLALSHCREAVSKDPSYSDAWVLLVLLLTAKKEMERATAVCKVAANQHPGDVRLLFLRAKLELQGGDQASGMKYLEKACRVCKEKEEVREVSKNAKAKRLRSVSLASLDDAEDKTTLATEEAPSMQPEAFQERERKVKIDRTALWLALCDVFLSNGQEDEARACLEEAKSTDQMHPDAIAAEGKVAEAFGDDQVALDAYRKAHALSFSHLPSLLALGRLYIRAGEMVLAEDALRSAVRAHPSAHEAWYALGCLYQQTGCNEKAIDCLEVAVELEETAPILPFALLPFRL